MWIHKRIISSSSTLENQINNKFKKTYKNEITLISKRYILVSLVLAS